MPIATRIYLSHHQAAKRGDPTAQLIYALIIGDLVDRITLHIEPDDIARRERLRYLVHVFLSLPSHGSIIGPLAGSDKAVQARIRHFFASSPAPAHFERAGWKGVTQLVRYACITILASWAPANHLDHAVSSHAVQAAFARALLAS